MNRLAGNIVSGLISLVLPVTMLACSEPDTGVLAESFPPSQTFMVFFDWDSSALSVQSLQSIREAVGRYKYFESTQIRVTGYTDQSGPADYNLGLSIRRAAAVKDGLVREGIPASAIIVEGKGDEPLVDAKGAREAQNCRVEIFVVAGGPKSQMRSWVLK